MEPKTDDDKAHNLLYLDKAAKAKSRDKLRAWVKEQKNPEPVVESVSVSKPAGKSTPIADLGSFATEPEPEPATAYAHAMGTGTLTDKQRERVKALLGKAGIDEAMTLIDEVFGVVLQVTKFREGI